MSEKQMSQIADIMSQFDTMTSEQIGTLISLSLEYLIVNHNYNFNKMLDTIQRVHSKIESGEYND